MPDPYTTLGVARSASEKEVKSAYRKLAKQLHPDSNKGNDKAADRFSQVTQAYDLLSDKNKRAAFDRGEIDGEGNPASPFGGMGAGMGAGMGGGRRGGMGGGMGGGAHRGQSGFGQGGFGQDGVDLGNLFEGLFGGGGAGGAARGSGGMGGMGGSGGPGGMGGPGGQQSRAQPPAKGADIHYRLNVPFVDAAARKDQRITLADGKTISLKLPEGVETGTQMRLKGKGQDSPGGTGGPGGARGAGGAGLKGDGLVTITIERHPFYTRDGDDVRLDLPITLDEAVRGAKIKVPTVDGPVVMTLKAGTNGGTVLRLGGKGFVKKSAATSKASKTNTAMKAQKRGDQLVTLEIILPDDLDALKATLGDWEDPGNPRENMGV